MQQVLSFGKQLEKPFEPGRSTGFISPAALTPLAAPLILRPPFVVPKGSSFLAGIFSYLGENY